MVFGSAKGFSANRVAAVALLTMTFSGCQALKDVMPTKPTEPTPAPTQAPLAIPVVMPEPKPTPTLGAPSPSATPTPAPGSSDPTPAPPPPSGPNCSSHSHGWGQIREEQPTGDPPEVGPDQKRTPEPVLVRPPAHEPDTRPPWIRCAWRLVRSALAGVLLMCQLLEELVALRGPA